jgi:hypothetical protein
MPLKDRFYRSTSKRNAHIRAPAHLDSDDGKDDTSRGTSDIALPGNWCQPVSLGAADDGGAGGRRSAA